MRQTKGRIVNLASIMFVAVNPGLVAHAASKGAVLQMIRALAHDLAPYGIRVNAIAPGEIAVTRSSRRFVNEAQSYHDFCRAMTKRCHEEGGPDATAAKTGPFYAVRLYVGDLGTFAGRKTNDFAEVPVKNAKHIGGLYSAGNNAASIGGITLGPAIIFGYFAARGMAGAND